MKANLKACLLKSKVFDTPVPGRTIEMAGQSAVLSFDQQKELLRLRLELETEKELAVEKMRQGIELERAVSLER